MRVGRFDLSGWFAVLLKAVTLFPPQPKFLDEDSSRSIDTLQSNIATHPRIVLLSVRLLKKALRHSMFRNVLVVVTAFVARELLPTVTLSILIWKPLNHYELRLEKHVQPPQ
jgi:hypothetical protein